jgi:hypothetical protein
MFFSHFDLNKFSNCILFKHKILPFLLLLVVFYEIFNLSVLNYLYTCVIFVLTLLIKLLRHNPEFFAFNYIDLIIWIYNMSFLEFSTI